MKKILIVFMMIFLISACDGSYVDVYNSIEKIKEVVGNEEFNDVYIKGSSFNKDKEVTYYFKKDNNDYCIEIDNLKTYIIKNNDSYHIYTSDKKHYKSDKSIEVILQEYLSFTSINPSLVETHENIAIHLTNLVNMCEKGEAICKIEKEIFNKVRIEIIQETDISKRVSEYEIDNGKIVYMSSEYREVDIYLRTVMELDYSNQKIENFNKNEYKIVNENS